MKFIKASLIWGMPLVFIAYVFVNSFVLVHDNYCYVENELLFSEFDLTREYQIKLDKVKQERQMVLDSLEVKIRQEQTALKGDENYEMGTYKSLVNEYESLKLRFEQQNQTLIAQYDGIVWKQLNAYIKSYGEEKGYQVILGASGNGNVMYASESLNVTQDLIKYVNEKYAGK